MSDLEKYFQHSVLLNSISWKAAEHLGYVKEGQEKIEVSTEDLFNELFDEFAWMKYRLESLEK